MISINEDNKNVAVESEVESTTQTESPQVEVPSTEEQTTQQSEDQQVEERATDDSSKSKDPREFQNRRLAEENRRLKSEIKKGSAFDAYRPQPGYNQPVDVRNYTDGYGQIDWQGYNQAVVANARQEANATAQQTVAEMLDEQNARSKYSELFEDPEVEQEIADRWLAAKFRGEEVTISDIAGRVAKRFSKDVSKAEKRGMEKALTEVNQKEQAGMSVAGQTGATSRQAQSEQDYEQSRVETRYGNEDAIVARLQKIPWANK